MFTWPADIPGAGQLLLQAAAALAYYLALVLLIRLAGKRLAGQITTFDLVVLIALAVVLQQLALTPGKASAVVFILVVFGAHRTTAWLCTRSATVKRLVRGVPRPLIVDGRVSHAALEEEGLSYEDLLAGLRKVGETDPRRIRLATLEETGAISVVVQMPGPGRKKPGG